MLVKNGIAHFEAMAFSVGVSQFHDKSIALQPVSVQGNTGLNIAAGVGVITLKYEP